MEVVSRDKFLAGSLEIPTGWDSLELEFTGPDGENLGKYGQLLGGGSTKVYDAVTDILDAADFALGGQSASQKVWFVKDPGNPRRIRFYTCFNALGTAELKLYLNGSATSIGGLTYSLTAAPDFAETIAYVDAWVKGFAFDLPGALPPVSGLSLAAPQASALQTAQSTSTATPVPLAHLTRACLIPFFNVVNQVEGFTSVVIGVGDGVKTGVQDDWAFAQLVAQGGVAVGDWAYHDALPQLQNWKTSALFRAVELKLLTDRLCRDLVFTPLQTLREDLSTWERFRKRSWQTLNLMHTGNARAWTVPRQLWGAVVDSLLEWNDDLYGRMLAGSELAHWQEAPWQRVHLLAEINAQTRVMGYTFGYTVGYVGEQVAMGAATAGVGKVVQVVRRGGLALAGSLAKRTVANLAARGYLLKEVLAAGDELTAEVVAAHQRGLSRASVDATGEGMPRLPMEMMQEAAGDGSRFNWRVYLHDRVHRPNVKKLVTQEGGEAVMERQFARLAYIFGNDFTEKIGRNFMQVADEFILVKRADGTIDECFEGFFSALEGNPSLLRHADDAAVRTGGPNTPLSANAKARLKQLLADADPNILGDRPGNPFRLDTPEEWSVPKPVPSNYWARGNLIELWKFKKVYKPDGFLHHPNATGFDYSGAAQNLYVQMKSLKNPDGAAASMREAIDSLIENSPPGSKLLLHIVKRPGSSSAELAKAITAHLGTKDRDTQARFLTTIIEELAFP